MKTVGVDISLRSTGVCLLGGDKPLLALVKDTKLRGVERLDSIVMGITNLLGEFRPALVAIEGNSYGSIHRGMDIGEAVGAVKLALYRMGISVIVVTPKQLKKFATGSGSATKRRMIEAASRELGYEVKSDDEADAFFLAKVALVYLTGTSTWRCELEVVRAIRFPEKKKRRKFKGVAGV